MMLRRSLVGWLAVVAALVAPSSALGALPARTWVSGVGSDANPCSRTAPCKTFAGAISKTSTGGEINVLDPGGFGAVTITKAITISAVGVTAGVQVGGTNGIVINTSTDMSPGDPDRDVVTLKGLTIDGMGPAAGASQGLSGVVIEHAGTVRLEHDEISGFGNDGVSFDPSVPTEGGAPTPTLEIEDSQIHDNTQDGVVAVPAPGETLRVFVSGSSIDGNGCGLAAGLEFTAFSDATCGTGSSGTGRVTLDSASTTVFGNAGVGVQSDGARASNTIAGDVVEGNAIGLEEFGQSTITAVGINYVFDNTANGTPTRTILGESGTVGLVCKTVTHSKTVTKRVHGHKRRVKVKVPEQVCTGTIGP